MTPNPYPNGQGEGLDDRGAPVVAYQPVSVSEALANGLVIAWPPYEPVEAKPCAYEWVIPAWATTDRRARKFYCDRPEGHPMAEHDDRWQDPDPTLHRCVTNLQEGTTLQWPDDATEATRRALGRLDSRSTE